MSIKKNIEIEYLRALAIILTLVGHLQALHYPHDSPYPWYYQFFTYYQPWTGVDLFFCISGYIISKTYMEYFDQHRQSNFCESFQIFWVKRAYRLIPAAWFWLLINFVCACLLNSTSVFGSIHDNICGMTAVFSFWANLANAKGILGPHVVYWSLALEEQFYLLFPLFLFLTTKNKRWVYLAIGILLQFFILRDTTGYAWYFRIDAMLWGILIHLFSQTKSYQLFKPALLKNSLLKRLLLLMLLVYMLGAIPSQLAVLPISIGLVALVCACLVWLASYQTGFIPSIPLISPVLAWFGTRSYSIYLVHMPAYRLCIELSKRYANFHHDSLDASYTISMAAFAAILTLGLSEFSYRFIEQPFRAKGAKFARGIRGRDELVDSSKNKFPTGADLLPSEPQA